MKKKFGRIIVNPAEAVIGKQYAFAFCYRDLTDPYLKDVDPSTCMVLTDIKKDEQRPFYSKENCVPYWYAFIREVVNE